jgi:hypothetical protein
MEVPLDRCTSRSKRTWGIAYIEDLRPQAEQPQDDLLDLDEVPVISPSGCGTA